MNAYGRRKKRSVGISIAAHLSFWKVRHHRRSHHGAVHAWEPWSPMR